MQYVGMQTQIRRNNQLSVLLLLMFPLIILDTIGVFLILMSYIENGYYAETGEWVGTVNWTMVYKTFLSVAPYVIGVVAIWFLIAYWGHASMIQRATHSRPLTRRENPRVYNLVENLCIVGGMETPKIYVVDDPQLNAFASGINQKTYAVTLTTGIISRLNDEELAGVIGHELTHIRNHDTRLLITSVVFVGIVSTVMTLLLRMIYYNVLFGGRKRDKSEKGGGIIFVLLIGAVLAIVAYFFTVITRFAISRRREYMADAGGAELCGNPLALASALKKISQDPGLDDVNREDIAQMFIMHPDNMETGLIGMIDSLFSTHPDVRKRIEILEQF